MIDQLKSCRLNTDHIDLLFRLLFSSIFLGLGMEHLFSDLMIQNLIPTWMPWPRLVSIACGLILVFGGSTIFFGYLLRFGSVVLGIFLIVVTLVVHVPGVMTMPSGIPENWQWIWDVLQRSNLVKNLCLLGVCFKLYYYEPGKYSLQAYLNRSKKI